MIYQQTSDCLLDDRGLMIEYFQFCLNYLPNSWTPHWFYVKEVLGRICDLNTWILMFSEWGLLILKNENN